jgi:minor extracellular serine protease Vpr
VRGVPSLVLVVWALIFVGSAGADIGGDPASKGTPSVDTGQAAVLLRGEPLATYVKTKPQPGKKIDFTSSQVKSYRAQLSALRNDFREWLRANAPAARVTKEFDISLNAVAVELNGTLLATIAEAPMVAEAHYQSIYRPAADADLDLISAAAGWGAGGPAEAGKGVKIAILDSGIALENPCFDDAGYPAQPGSSPFTNNKVIVAKVFGNRVRANGWTPAPGTHVDNEHGTHVAGTAACNYGTFAIVYGLPTYPISGVAPAAWLGNYNVFPGDQPRVRWEDLVDALEEAYEDDMDVANMSIVGLSSGTKDLISMAVDNLDRAGMVIAVAGGNNGPGHFTVTTPGIAERALTAGSATVGHYLATRLTAGSSSYDARIGEFQRVTSTTTAPLAVLTTAPTWASTGLSTLCSTVPTGVVEKVLLISRGDCLFSVKVRNAQAAGAGAVLIVNNIPGDAPNLGTDGLPSQPTTPAYALSLSDGLALKPQGGVEVTIAPGGAYSSAGLDDKMSNFSSQGPTDVDFRVKPDVVAPGENVISSWPAFMCGGTPACFGFMQGTSMATPHLAGAAAVLLSQHDWAAAAVRSAIVNTADEGTLLDFETLTPENDLLVTGTGRLNLARAAAARVALEPVSVSFGAVPAGAGRTRTATVALSSLADTGLLSVTVSSATGNGVTYSASLSPGTITVTMTAEKQASFGDHQAMLRVFAGGTEVAHAVVYTLVK